MVKSEFYDIIKTDDIQLKILKTSHFSIGTSPYYAHQHGLAIDIYQNLDLNNYEVLSPVSGKIIKIKSLAAPKPKYFEGLNNDYLILISNPHNSELLWKMMHVKPNVKVGEKINIGDILGRTIRNGYFAYWSSPHLHLEIRPFNDAIRARGGKNYTLAIGMNNKPGKNSEGLNTNKIPVKIHSIYPEMILVNLPKNFYHYLYPIYGLKARMNNTDCIIDGGIPHYKIGTVISPQKFISENLFPVYIGRHKIGTLHEIRRQFGFFKFRKVKFLLNNKEIRGISLYLANFPPLIKIIPNKKNEFSFSPKSFQYLTLISCDLHRNN
ncbi:MAG: M23 family metallopeptidase [Promethearchaeota archaeon]